MQVRWTMQLGRAAEVGIQPGLLCCGPHSLSGGLQGHSRAAERNDGMVTPEAALQDITTASDSTALSKPALLCILFYLAGHIV
jgi:hypothetical protein